MSDQRRLTEPHLRLDGPDLLLAGILGPLSVLPLTGVGVNSYHGGTVATVAVLGIANTPFAWLNPSLLWLSYVLPVLWAASLRAEAESLYRRDGCHEAARLPPAS
jgi:hypothetical protein